MTMEKNNIHCCQWLYVVVVFWADAFVLFARVGVDNDVLSKWNLMMASVPVLWSESMHMLRSYLLAQPLPCKKKSRCVYISPACLAVCCCCVQFWERSFHECKKKSQHSSELFHFRVFLVTGISEELKAGETEQTPLLKSQCFLIRDISLAFVKVASKKVQS